MAGWKSLVDSQARPRDAVNVSAMLFAALRVGSCCLAVGVLAAAIPVTIVVPDPAGSSWTPSAIAKLDADLDATIAASPALRGAHFGIFAIDTATDAVLYARNPDDEVQPASTLKLVVGSAALDRLKPNFTWRTSAAYFGESALSGRAPSILVTTAGDPTLSAADLRDAVAAIAVPTIGAIAIDDGIFDRQPYPNGWTWDDFGQDYAPVVSAATLDENTVDLRVSPGANVGDRARVDFVDARRSVASARDCDGRGDAPVSVIDRANTGIASSDDTIDVTLGESGCLEVIGSIPLGAASETIAAAVARPANAMREALRGDLAAQHVLQTQSAPAVLARTNVGDAFWTHDSKPLSALLGPRFWIPSDNLFGELLLKELGLAASGRPGTTAGGIAAEKQWLASIGVDPASVTLADGCGMSQYDRITARDLVTILTHDWNGPNRRLVLDSLPVGGARGTIEGIAGTAAAGRVFAKTGSMMHVRGLAGYLATERHGAVTFAFEVDDWNGDYPTLAALRANVLSRIVDDPS